MTLLTPELQLITVPFADALHDVAPDLVCRIPSLSAAVKGVVERSAIAVAEVERSLELVRPWLVEPIAVVLIEVDTPVGAAEASLLIRSEGGVLLRVGSDANGEPFAQFARHALGDVPMVLANYVDLGPRPDRRAQPGIESFVIDVEALRSIPTDAVTPGDVMDALSDTEGAATSAMVALLLASRRSSWKMTATWWRDGRVTTRSLAILDAGPGGLWTLESGEASVIVTPTAPSVVIREIVELLPRQR